MSAKTNAGSVYIARLSKSFWAGESYKFALRAPIWEKGKFHRKRSSWGCWWPTVMTDSAEETLLPRDAPQTAVLIGRWDAKTRKSPIRKCNMTSTARAST